MKIKLFQATGAHKGH